MATHQEVSDFLSAVRTAMPEDMVRRCRGTVVAYDAVTETVTVTLSAGSVECPGVHFMDWYNPTVGDDVHILMVDEDKVVYGKIRRP